MTLFGFSAQNSKSVLIQLGKPFIPPSVLSYICGKYAKAALRIMPEGQRHLTSILRPIQTISSTYIGEPQDAVLAEAMPR